jgi:hypothetical protein
MAKHLNVNGHPMCEPEAEAPELTIDLDECTCVRCCWRVVQLAHQQMGATLRRLHQIVAKVDVITKPRAK